MSTISTPYGGTGAAEYRRPIRPVGGCRSRGDVVRRCRSEACPLLSADEIEQLLTSQQLFLNAEYRDGHRVDFSSADLAGRDFARRSLRRIKMDRALG